MLAAKGRRPGRIGRSGRRPWPKVSRPRATAALPAPRAPSTVRPYLNPELDFEARARDLVSRMTVEERMKKTAPQRRPRHPAPRRRPATWWQCEGLHGVARAGVATVFPQAIGLAASWDVPLHLAVATAISDEARAKHHDSLRKGEIAIYTGPDLLDAQHQHLRRSRWGWGQETHGEDPFLTARLGVAFVRGMQGDDPRGLKTIACAKHYAVHSGREATAVT